MRIFDVDARASAALALLVLATACDKESQPQAETVRSAAPSAAPEPEPPPRGCSAGDEPVKLGSATGYVYGLTGDAAHLYFGTWQVYGGRGDLAKVRKDGKGKVNLTSLSLEPRGTVVDDKNVYFTSGIRLMSVPKDGGEAKVLAPKFSSQSIAGNGSHVFGVPGDYGPYDRLIRAEKSSGKTYELDVSERPETKEPPRGFSSIVVDESGIYVADSSGNRVLSFGFERAKPKVLTKQEKPFSLTVDDTDVYFSLARKKELMSVPKAGGSATKLASGLVQDAHIAGDAQGIYTTLAGDDDKAEKRLVRVPTVGGKPIPLATIAGDRSVDGIAVDGACVYWVEREAGSGDVAVMARAR